MEITCLKCGKLNMDAAGDAAERCPACGVIYSKAVAPPARAEPKTKRPPSRIWRKISSLDHLEFIIPFCLAFLFACFQGFAARLDAPELASFCATAAIISVAIFAAVVVYTIVKNNKIAEAKRQAAFEAFIGEDGFRSTDLFFGAAGHRAIAIDDTRKQIYLYTFMPSTWKRVVSFADLLSVEMHEDGTTISTTSGGAGIGRAVVGRALFGVAGEIIGGTTGKRKTTSQNLATVIEIRITIKNVNDPIWDMRFLSSQVDRNSQLYSNVSTRARKCVGSISAAIALQ